MSDRIDNCIFLGAFSKHDSHVPEHFVCLEEFILADCCEVESVFIEKNSMYKLSQGLADSLEVGTGLRFLSSRAL